MTIGLLKHFVAATTQMDTSTNFDSATVCDSVTGVEVPSNSEKQGLTSFVNEACESVFVSGAAHKLPPGTTYDTQVEDLKSYLARPLKISQGSMSTTTGVVYGTTLNTTNLKAGQALSRLQGCYGYRFTLVFRLEIASTPFIGGRARMIWIPCAVNRASSYAFYLGENSVSMVPGVDIDFVESTSAELRVPYVHYLDYLPWNPQIAIDYGTFELFQMLPSAGGAGFVPPTYSLWLSYEDVHMIGSAPPALVTVTPQSGLAPASKESGNRYLSTALAATSSVMSIAAGSFPAIASYTAPLAWVSRYASRLASTFGYSKPNNHVGLTRVIKTNYNSDCYIDGMTVSKTMGAMTENSIVALDGFASSGIDEMDFDFFLGREAVCCKFTLSTQVADAEIYCANLTPFSFWYQTGNKCNTVPNAVSPTPPAVSGQIQTTPLFYLANIFGKWRGGFKFKFTSNKTKFHTGRLLFSYVPIAGMTVAYSATPTFTGYDTSVSTLNAHTAIWDLRQDNTFEFECPYLAPTQYLSKYRPMGTLMVTVMEPLQAPSTCSNLVTMHVYVAAMPGFSFACPVGTSYLPTSTPTNIVVQSGLTHESTNIGESIRSVKQLIQRACNSVINTSTALAVASASPWWYANPTVTVPDTNIDYTTYFQRCYVFARGSTEYHYTPISDNVTFYSYMLSFDGTVGIPNMTTLIVENDGALHVTLPFYSNSSRVVVGGAPFSLTDVPFMGIGLTGATGHAPQAFLSVAASDDSQLGFYLGTPVLQLHNVNQSATNSALSNALNAAYP